MVMSVNQLSLYGAVADLIKELPADQRAPGKPVALDQMEQEILIQPPLAEVQANDERQGNLLQDYERRFERLPEDQKLSKLCSEAGLNLVEVEQFLYASPSPDEPEIQSFCREYALARDKEENCAKGWIGNNARFGPVLDIKVCKTIGRYSVEVKFPFLFEDQTTSGIRIVSGVEKYVRETMPIQEEERASGRPAAKARPMLKPSSTSNPNPIPMRERKWIDIEVRKSRDHYCFQMSKFITQLLRHKEFGREEDAGVPHDRIVEKCKEVLSEDSRCWSDEVKQKFKGGPVLVSGEVDRRSVKRWWTKEKVSILFETMLSRKTPVTSSFKGHSGKAYSGNAPFNPVLQDNVLLPKNFTKYVYHVGHGNELRSIVRNGLVPGGFSTKTGRCAVFFTVVDQMDDKQGLRETFCDLIKSKNHAIQEYLETTSGHSILVQFFARSRRRTAIFNKQGPMRSSSMTHCLQSSLRKRYARKRKNSFTKEKAQDHALCSKQIRIVNHKIYPVKKQDHLGKHKSDAQSFWETGCKIVDYRIPGISLSTVQQQDEQRQHTVAKLIEKFESHQYKEQFLKDMSQTQKINRFSEASQKLLKDMDQTEIFEIYENTTKLQSPACNSFTEIGIIYCSYGRNLKYKRSPTTFRKDNFDYNSIAGCII